MILSLTGTAEQIKEAVDIPVVTIPFTAFDVMRTIYSLKPFLTKIALITYREKIYGINDIEKMLGVSIFEYTIEPSQVLSEVIEDIKRREISAVIAGVKLARLAEQHGLKGVLRYCGEETVHHSIHEAIRLARVQQLERSLATRIGVAFDSLTEGIIVTDEHNIARVYNPAAEKIFKIPRNQVIGQEMQAVLPSVGIHRAFESGQAELDILQEINGVHVASNHIPVLLDGTRIGGVATFENVTKIQQLEQFIRKTNHAKGFVAKNKFEDILSIDPQMKELKALALLYASTDSSVVIHGESGTGKELFAQSIHNASHRANSAFVAVNCAALPENLLESELFGYEGGSFTGARREGKLGLFELAHTGTIFLDEVGEIPRSLQARLLRVLQEKEIMRIGGNKIIPVNIRIISATNIDLVRKIEQGSFREDLYYRLNVLNLELPSLKNRKQDIPLLATHFLKKMDICVHDKRIQELTSLLINYDWPGNIRELYNIMERLSLLIISSPADEPWGNLLKKVLKTTSASGTEMSIKINLENGLKVAVATVEQKYIEFLLAKHNQNYDEVARRLGISRTTLWRKAKESS